MSETPTIVTGTLQVPGATLHHELRGAGGALVVLHAAPMDARSFEPLADLLATDHTVLTSDPRGIARSTVADRRQPATPDQRADDLARLIEHVDRGPAVVLGSSGGAVSALALAASRPALVAGVIAHEPPLATLLDDQAAVRAATEKMIATYRAGDRRSYWTQFLATAGIEMPDEVFEMVFGDTPTGRDAQDEQFGVEQMHMPTTFWEPPLGALRTGGVPIAVGIGTDSTGQFCDRTAQELAHALGIEPTMFPGDHIGFTDHPQAFATAMRATMDTLARGADDPHEA